MNNVLEYLEIAAQKYPDKKAISCREKSYSFEQLLETSKRIGSEIVQHGIKNAPIGIIAKHDIETIALFMGVLYSGCFYVPIDPDLPEEKFCSICQDASFAAILADTKDTIVKFEKLFETQYIVLDEITNNKTCDIPNVGGNDPLYMVYTSGSTGKPKGVLKSHHAEISFVEAYCAKFNFSEDEIIGNQTPFFFDASGKDIYMMLKLGCTVEILPSTLFMLPPELIDYLNQKKVTFASWVPTVLSIVSMLNPFSMVKPITLKRVFFVGEVMPMKHLNKWRRELPNISYVNLYGQSELAGICCYYEVKDKSFEDSETLPIGVPLDNCRIYLMDNQKIITTPGQVGELYIVSDALALEYYHDRIKTEESFLYHDFGNGPERCFKTGDFACYDNDGNLIFASRSDSQIKHMGHRIELGEIETIAGALPGIQRCCCLYDNAQHKIVLFCEIESGVTLDGIQIKRELKSKLSDYMVPGKVVVMQLPLNQNGKINRQELKKLL